MEDHIRPDLPSKCTWSLNTTLPSPHRPSKPTCNEEIKPTILHAIGNTPIVRLNKIPKSAGLKCEILAKCEYMNPGGSLKDRVILRMVEEAEDKGILKPGSTLIEPSSGNTAQSLALVAAIKGYECIIVMPKRMSEEKEMAVRALGARVVRTTNDYAYDAPGGLFDTVQKLHRETPNSVVLNQFKNADNPLAHYYSTGPEILKQCNGKVDMFVMGAGTGGALTGIARYLREHCPNIRIVGVDPDGSHLAEPPELNITDKPITLEGMGYVFVPTNLDRSLVDKWLKISDEESFVMARRLIREEGLLCGGSSGALMAGALKAAAELKEGQRCVILLPDSIRNYMTKLVDDNWMKKNGYYK